MPSACSETVPCEGVDTPVTLSGSPLGSAAPASTSTTIGPPGEVTLLSVAVGAAFPTVTVTVAVAVFTPSEIV